MRARSRPHSFSGLPVRPRPLPIWHPVVWLFRDTRWRRQYCRARLRPHPAPAKGAHRWVRSLMPSRKHPWPQTHCHQIVRCRRAPTTHRPTAGSGAALHRHGDERPLCRPVVTTTAPAPQKFAHPQETSHQRQQGFVLTAQVRRCTLENQPVASARMLNRFVHLRQLCAGARMQAPAAGYRSESQSERTPAGLHLTHSSRGTAGHQLSATTPIECVRVD